MTSPPISDSPFFDKEFAAQTPGFHKTGPPPTPKPRTEPDRYSTNITCRECQTQARIETHPTKTIYRCPACQKLLATITPNAEVTTP